MGWATTCRFGKFTLERSKRRLLRDGVPVELEDRVLDLILVLLDHRERAMDRREIVDALWGKRPVGDTTLRQLLYKARRVLGDDGAQQTIIRTLHGRGVQWVAPVAPTPDLWATATVPDKATLEPERAPMSGLRATIPVVWRAQINVGARASTPTWAATALTTSVKRPGPPQPRTTWSMTVALLALASLTTVGVLWLRPVPYSPMSTKSPGSLSALASNEPVMLVVLPFVNLGPESDTSYLSDGLSDELINRLGASYPGVRVAARTSALVFHQQPLDLRTAASKLGATSILEGSVQRAGDRWRVRVALISAKDGYVVWSAKYDPPRNDLITLEDAIAGDVVRQLLPRLYSRSAMARSACARADQAARAFDWIANASNRCGPAGRPYRHLR